MTLEKQIDKTIITICDGGKQIARFEFEYHPCDCEQGKKAGKREIRRFDPEARTYTIICAYCKRELINAKADN